MVAAAQLRPPRWSSPPVDSHSRPSSSFSLHSTPSHRLRPPAAITPSSSSSTSLFFLFQAAYIAEMEYPFLDPPLHTWHEEHRFFDGLLQLHKIDTVKQLGDIFTKVLTRFVFEHLRKKIMRW